MTSNSIPNGTNKAYDHGTYENHPCIWDLVPNPFGSTWFMLEYTNYSNYAHACSYKLPIQQIQFKLCSWSQTNLELTKLQIQTYEFITNYSPRGSNLPYYGLFLSVASRSPSSLVKSLSWAPSLSIFGPLSL